MFCAKNPNPLRGGNFHKTNLLWMATLLATSTMMLWNTTSTPTLNRTLTTQSQSQRDQNNFLNFDYNFDHNCNLHVDHNLITTTTLLYNLEQSFGHICFPNLNHVLEQAILVHNFDRCFDGSSYPNISFNWHSSSINCDLF